MMNVKHCVSKLTVRTNDKKSVSLKYAYLKCDLTSLCVNIVEFDFFGQRWLIESVRRLTSELKSCYVILRQCRSWHGRVRCE